MVAIYTLMTMAMKSGSFTGRRTANFNWRLKAAIQRQTSRSNLKAAAATALKTSGRAKDEDGCRQGMSGTMIEAWLRWQREEEASGAVSKACQSPDGGMAG